MNWSAYSRFVGDIFGAPLAREGLIAFFLESTFLGLWIFGRGHPEPAGAPGHDLAGRRGHHPSVRTSSWPPTAFMQHPVGLVYDPAKNRVELTSIWKVLTNSTQLVTFPHTVLAAFMTAAALLLSVSAWHLSARPRDHADPVHRKVAAMDDGRAHGRGHRHLDRRSCAGPDHDRPAADEDGGGRSPVGHPGQRAVQPGRVRRCQQGQEQVRSDHSGRALHPGQEPPERHRAGREPDSGGRGGEVRTRQLRFPLSGWLTGSSG